MILDVVVKWPGAVHDTRIFADSGIKKIYERGKLASIEILYQQVKKHGRNSSYTKITFCF